jgi:hypothetical protein
VGAAASIAALAGTVGLRLLQPTTKFNQAVIQGESLVLDSPRFIGQTKSGDKVIVTAQKATRILSDDNAPVKLEQPVLETGDGSKARGKTGTWSQTTQTMTLAGGVVLLHRSGDEATATSAIYAAGPGQLTLSDQVVLTQATGDTVTGNRAIWSKSPEVLTVEGAVTITRKGGQTARATRAVWQAALGLLELSGGVELQLQSGERATAQTAQLDEKSGDLTLEGDVVVQFKSGQARSARARFTRQTGVLVGDGGVQFNSDMGSGNADSYVYETRTKRLNMRGNARVTRN